MCGAWDCSLKRLPPSVAFGATFPRKREKESRLLELVTCH